MCVDHSQFLRCVVCYSNFTMSDSEGSIDLDYASYFEDRGAEADETPAEPPVKQESDDENSSGKQDDSDDDESIKQESDDDDDNKADVAQESDSEDVKVFKAKRRSRKQLNREYMKLRVVREQQLTEQIFGDKNKYLERLTDVTKDIKTEPTDTKKRKPVWHDPADEGRGLITRIDNYKCEVTEKGVYKQQLEGKFRRLIGTPSWANLERKKKPGDSDDDDDEILQTVGHIATPTTANLAGGQLQFKRMKDLNRETYAEGPLITDVRFHPSSSVSLVSGTRGLATIYSIDGKKNSKLHSMEFKNFPIRRCRFTKNGDEAIFGGSQKYFYSYNLIGGQTQRIFLPKVITKMTNFEISPCDRYVAVIGRFGEVHVLFANSYELVCTLKQEHDATSVAFSRDSKYLFCHCVDAEVSIFDIGQRRFVHRFIDDGCINGTHISISPNGQMVAAASQQGVVNVYNYDDVFQSKLPRPQKTIMNLTTAISNTVFNHSSELLAIASKEVPDAVKIVHFPSATVYQNFPAMNSFLGKPHTINFSPQSGFLAIGSTDKQVSLFRLKHFNNF